MDVILNWSFVVFFLAGVAGMFSHWAKRWLRLETTSSLFGYLFSNHARYTASAFLAYVGAVLALVFGGHADFESTQALGLAYAMGYGIDSALNKDIKLDEGHARVRNSFKSAQ